ncbi:MAG TPA: CHC2 zinc finger domain-containing protein [Terriglobales bacterium]|nr:CHC2 zinc finger domain-containing protein [Terriglobales bacterium]
MARIAESEIERLKREISVQRLAEGRGVKLKRHGADLIGLCPFHNDHEPSLVITPSKNLWNCLGACRRGGTVIDWIMLAEGVSFRHAVELLREDLPLASNNTRPGVQRSTVPKLPAPVERTADDSILLLQVVSFYQESLKQSPEALKYLERRGLQSAEMIDTFRLGFANRTIGYRLPASNRNAGAALRGRLQKLGIYRESGHEHFNGSVVIPICDLSGQVVQMYGRKITPNLRPGTPDHLYLPGPHRGVWNETALAVSKDIILCEALIDALTFWCAGYRNVTAIYGVNGFTEEHRAAFQKHGTQRIYLAYDRDEAGEGAAQEHAAQLMEIGIECFRVQFPKNMDANEYALKVQPASKSLGIMLNRAAWLGKGERPTVAVIEPVKAEPAKIEPVKVEPPPEPAPQIEAQTHQQTVETLAAPILGEKSEEKNEPAAKEENAIPLPASLPAAPVIEEPEKVFSLAAQPQSESSEESAPIPPTPAAPARSEWQVLDAPVEIKGDEIIIHQGDRRYRVRGLAKNMSYELLRINLLVSGKNTRGENVFHVDTFDLYSARQRTVFLKQAAEELGVKDDVIRRDLGHVLLQLEALQDQQIKQALEPEEKQIPIGEHEREAAMELLRDPRLVDRILSDLERCGMVGEETNKLVSYLAVTSRLLDAPLAILVQASSAAGKSALMEAVLALVPEEQQVQYSAMTGQSLFYMGESDLKHKVLAIVEEEGALRAAYALKLLQSEGVLTIASTGKDATTGRLITHQYRVEGPVMIFLTTTAIDLDEELLNRCLVLTVDEDRAQTQAIHQKQREAQTLEGLLAKHDRNELLTTHRNAQRLLKPMLVVNPYARELTFLDSQTRTRRDHMKYLTLIRSIALLYQYQRPHKTATHRGQTLEYIEVTKDDIAMANRLAHEVLGRSLDELPPQTRRLLLLVDEMVRQDCEQKKIERQDFRFSRKDVRVFSRWSDSQLKRHLHRLEELEYLVVHQGGRGQSMVYELVFERREDSARPALPGLIEIEKLSGCEYDGKKSGLESQRSGSSPAQVRGASGSGAGRKSPATTRAESDFYEDREKNTSWEREQNPVLVVPPIVAAKTNGVALAEVK